MPSPHSYERFLNASVIVSGAGGGTANGVGVGQAIALAFAREGAGVCVFDASAPRAAATQRQIDQQGGRAIVCVGDVTSAQDCDRCVRETIGQFGSVNVLVNNVGVIGPTERVADLDIAAWSSAIDVNLKGAFLLSRSVIPVMLENGGGAIIHISSIAGILSHGAAAYGPSKSALASLAREIAVMYGAQGIRANTIAPGYLWTPIAEKSGSASARNLRRAIAPMNIEGDAWDIASAALFLASAEARFITGVELPVDGGASILGPLTAFALSQREA